MTGARGDWGPCLYGNHRDCAVPGCPCTSRDFHASPHEAEITHMCPPDGGGLMPCCGQTPFEVPRTDRITADPERVTCGRGNEQETGS
jgi:hypothetical protein